ncbi:MAG: hypothetical protein KAU20_05455 [Nanoarchaeota archaeon]|nr:hypothetical protein [Nanoarchaeota archaeon]
MADYTVQAIALTGLEPALVAVALSDAFINDGRTFLVVSNGSGGSIDVTIDCIVPCNYGHDHDIVVAVPAGEDRWIGEFSTGRFNSSEGKVTVGYSAITTVTAGAVRI